MTAPATAVASIDAHLSDEKVCRLLVSRQLLAEAQAADILKRKKILADKLEALRRRKGGQLSGAAPGSVSIVDIIASLNLTLPQDRKRLLDE